MINALKKFLTQEIDQDSIRTSWLKKKTRTKKNQKVLVFSFENKHFFLNSCSLHI